MSIFKESFKEGVKNQLKTRQNAMINRTPQNLQWLNSRNAWVRMSSAVDIIDTIDANGVVKTDNGYMAKKNVLQGGTLKANVSPNSATTYELKSGIGTYDNAYSNISYDNTNVNRLGLRPMPGITSVEVKSRGAYGSLQDVTVNFQCWDIKQLEELELLYMRPGYTVLIEWGWSPYLDKSGSYQAAFNDYYDIIDKPKPKEEIWKDLAKRSEDTYPGNVESMFGYVKNYSWTARMDGGYDCQTVIISLGEVLESLKVNYTPAVTSQIINNVGLINPLLVTRKLPYSEDFYKGLKDNYTKNILAGLFYELYQIASSGSVGPLTVQDNENIYDLSKLNIDIQSNHQSVNSSLVGTTQNQIYITLESLTKLLNKYVLLNSRPSNGSSSPYAQVTTKDKDKDDLCCNAYPLQISVDPTVCLIDNPIWSKMKFEDKKLIEANKNDPAKLYDFGQSLTDPEIREFLKTLVNVIDTTFEISDVGKDKITKTVIDFINKGATNDVIKIANITAINRIYVDEFKNKSFTLIPTINKNILLTEWGAKISLSAPPYKSNHSSFYDLLDDNNGANLGSTRKKRIFINSKFQEAAESDTPLKDAKAKRDEENKAQKQISTNINSITNKINNSLSKKFFTDSSKSPKAKDNKCRGIIGNIYVNLQKLYDISLDSNLQNQDPNEKNDVAVYDFIKNILREVSNSIGNVQNFELFIEPNESVGRIIDINFTGKEKTDVSDIFNKAFLIEVHNLKSTVRSYKLESKIFPNQSTQVAIGAQVGGGALGVDVSSLINFNRGIQDRIIPIKDAPIPTSVPSKADKIAELEKNVQILSEYFANLGATTTIGGSGGIAGLGGSTSITLITPQFNVDNSYKNALKDIINYFKTLVTTHSDNRAILPTVLSLEMDGIGGVIIGNVFRISEDILPKGYKNIGKLGNKLGYVVTGLGHSLQNNDWVTRIDAQTIILDDPFTNIDNLKDMNYDFSVINLNPISPITPVTITPTPTDDKMTIALNAVFGQNKEQKSLCAGYTYNIARAYKIALEGKTPTGELQHSGNAETLEYRSNLVKLGYKPLALGPQSREQLLGVINGPWKVGEIINYRLSGCTDYQNKKSESYAKHGHTQIYIGNGQWASSYRNNYGASFVYGTPTNSLKNQVWEVYTFRK